MVYTKMELTTVTLLDPRATTEELNSWARKHCVSYTRYIETDVSDVSYTVDLICEFFFADPKDATLFTLRWA